MMKIAMCLAASLLLMPPASAHWRSDATRVEFTAPVPCAVACPGWMDSMLPPDAGEAVWLEPCGDDLPSETYDEVDVVMPAPPDGRVVVLEATIDMSVDWDLYLCNAGAVVYASTLGFGEACYLHSPIDYFYGLGCHEDVAAVAPAGTVLTIRAFNIADTGTAQGRYWFTVV